MVSVEAGYAIVVDDEPANRDFAERLIQMAAYKVSGAGSGADALKIARGLPKLALALVDMELPDTSGIDLIQTLRKENPTALLVMATMHDDRAMMSKAFAAGCDVFLVKPHGYMELLRRLREAGADTLNVRRMIIDQYGPRPFRG